MNDFAVRLYANIIKLCTFNTDTVKFG